MDPRLYGTDELVVDLLRNSTTWAVVGLGTDPERPAYGVSAFLQSIGKRIIPVHPRAAEVHGEKGYATLTEAAAMHPEIDVVDCFVASSRVGRVMDEAVELGLPAIWTQLEISDEAAAENAVAHGVRVVMNRCPAIEWPRLIGH